MLNTIMYKAVMQSKEMYESQSQLNKLKTNTCLNKHRVKILKE
jgi:hypothetical protein